jgi:hypothetical protein
MIVASIFGMLCISYVLGAAVMKFDWPTAGFFRSAFAFLTRTPRSARHQPGLELDEPGRTYDGFTLYSTTAECRAVLVDMKGKVVHDWVKPFSSVWLRPPHVKEPVSDDNVIFSSGRLFPNGDLLAVFEAPGDRLCGYGLVRLDRNSNVIWQFPDNVHGEVDVGEDGRIYALTQRVVSEPPKGLEWLPQPYLTDDLVVLSRAGEELKKIRLLEALRESKDYNLMVEQIRNHQDPLEGENPPTIKERGLSAKSDLFHANSVKVLTQEMAARFSKFKAGQVLISLRELSALIVVDVDSGSIVWAIVGPWRGQHSARFLDNGRLLLLDNRGIRDESRVIEFDPRDLTLPWSMPKDSGDFGTLLGGELQRLPNGNTLVSATVRSPTDAFETGELREVTQDGAVVWLLRCEPRVACGARYDADQIRFLENSARPRP